MMNSSKVQTDIKDPLTRAKDAFEIGNMKQAFELAAIQLQRDPSQAEAHFVAGMASMELRQFSRALEHLHQAASRQPRRADYAVQFAKALAKTHRTGEALQVANIAFTLSPDDEHVLGTLGVVYTQAHAHERAAMVFRQAAAIAPGSATARFNLAMSLTFGGDIEQAEVELEACLAIAPTHWRARDSLSRLRRQTQDRNNVNTLLALSEEQQGNPEALARLHSALGKELEDLGQYPEAFEHYSLGKSASASRLGYSIAQDEAIFQSLAAAFPIGQQPALGCLSSEPIFVMGMPRSGTTLVERILSSHPEVYSAGEMENFGVAVERLSGIQSPVQLSSAVVDKARRIDNALLGEHYLQSTRPATCMKPRFVDKLPHNFLYAGFIANALPRAKIICLRRHPMDTCLSNFREPFAESSAFHGYSFDLLDIGRYYIQFDRLMTHWNKVFPGRIFEVQYETMVGAQEIVSRRILQHCELPWNDSCLHFEQNRAPSNTASSVQVRKPIHSSSVGRWKRYAPQLAELRKLLTDAGVECGD